MIWNILDAIKTYLGGGIPAGIGLTNITEIITAIAALGTAASGFVDTLKTLPKGGVSHIGFRTIKARLKPVASAFTAIGELDPWNTLHANWINGVATSQQKAIVKSLVYLGLTPNNAPGLAAALGVDKDGLIGATTSSQTGTPLTAQQTNVLGRFDTMLSALIDAGYEEADQQYRNWSKLYASIIAVVLAVIAAAFLGFNLILAVLIGLVSTPLAPVAKNLTSSLQAAASAMNAVKKPG